MKSNRKHGERKHCTGDTPPPRPKVKRPLLKPTSPSPLESDKRHTEERLSQVEEHLGYSFRDRALLCEALTHSSFSAEYPQFTNNERLEFLGDAALKLSATRLLLRAFPREREGLLTRVRAWMISDRHLAELDISRFLGEHLLLGKVILSQPEQGLDQRRANCLEAVIGAVFADGGYEPTDALISRLLEARIEQARADYREDSSLSQSLLFKDPKTLLQEHCIALMGEYPRYEERQLQSDPKAQPIFHVLVYVKETLQGEGRGPTKKAAGQEAARQALEALFTSQLKQGQSP